MCALRKLLRASTPAGGCDAYDELAYRSLPIEWSAPERLALCSLLHGGPRLQLEDYSVLELGCGDGANLIALANYRAHARFVGVDASRRAIESAQAKCQEAGVTNLRFVHASFEDAAPALSGRFDFVLVHGVFSWVTTAIRDKLLKLCRDKLAPNGLLYINYNTKPGWNVRGMLRDFLRAQTVHVPELARRAALAKTIALSAAAALSGLAHPYARLMEREWRFVCESHPSYIAHEFLAAENHAYWRSEVTALFADLGLHYVADADFNYPCARVPEDLMQRIEACGWHGLPAEDTADLFSYRQLHSAIFSLDSNRQPAAASELAQLFVASELQPQAGSTHFQHHSGYTVEVRDGLLRDALETLAACWPRGLRAHELLSDVASHADDLRLLHRHGMIELRLSEPLYASPASRLAISEQRWAGYVTDPYHRVSMTEPL